MQQANALGRPEREIFSHKEIACTGLLEWPTTFRKKFSLTIDFYKPIVDYIYIFWVHLVPFEKIIAGPPGKRKSCIFHAHFSIIGNEKCVRNTYLSAK